jgi:hypothetical protein
VAIPFQTTFISIVRGTLPQNEDPYDPISAYPSPATAVIAAGIRAVVTVPGGTTALIAGQRVMFDTQLTCDPCDMQAGDIVTESSGTVWQCLSATPFGAFAISGVKASLRRVTGFGS